MKVIIPQLSTVYSDKFTLKREIDNGFIIEKLGTKVDYYKEDHRFLMERWTQGDDRNAGTIEIECGDQVLEKNVYIKHNEGSFDLRQCKTTKELTLENALDCVVRKTINIFDYTATETNSIQGTVRRVTYEFPAPQPVGNIIAPFYNDPYGIEDILPLLNIQYLGVGYVLESGDLSAELKLFLEPQGQIPDYEGHEITGYLSFIRIESDIQHSEDWIYFPAGDFYYLSTLKDQTFSLKETLNRINLDGGATDDYIGKRYAAGRDNLYTNTEISNTIGINQILVDIFSCTGKTLISNFLGIASDATAPSNKYYEWANDFAQNIKIVQSYDILKADAEQDSFDGSGDIKVKDLLENLFTIYGLKLNIDGSNIRLEHLTYFTGKGIDLTSTSYEIKPIEINKELINSESWNFAKLIEDTDFYSATIEYETNNIYNKPNDIKYPAPIILTDLFGGLNKPELVESGDFKKFYFLLSTDGANVIGLNNAFSMLNLVTNLHDTNRPLKTGSINSNQITFGANSLGATGELIIRGNSLQWDLLNPLMSIKTNEGYFIIESIEINEKDILTIEIKK